MSDSNADPRYRTMHDPAFDPDKLRKQGLIEMVGLLIAAVAAALVIGAVSVLINLPGRDIATAQMQQAVAFDHLTPTFIL